MKYSGFENSQAVCLLSDKNSPHHVPPPPLRPSLLTQYCVNLEKNHVRQYWPRTSKQTCNLHRISGEEFALTLQFILVWRHFSFKSVSFWRLLISLEVAFCEGKCNYGICNYNYISTLASNSYIVVGIKPFKSVFDFCLNCQSLTVSHISTLFFSPLLFQISRYLTSETL